MRLTLSKGPKHSKPASLSQTESVSEDLETDSGLRELIQIDIDPPWPRRQYVG